MMCSPVPLMLVALSAALAAPANVYEAYPIVMPQKRAALVLDRLLIALSKALHDSPPRYQRDDGPRALPLRYADDDMPVRAAMAADEEWLGPEDLRVAPLGAPVHDFSDVSGLQRRGQPGGGAGAGAGSAGVRGRVLRCYFNAITCF